MAVSSADQRRLAPWPRFGSGALETVHVRRLIDVVNARLYSADHRALLLLKCMMSSELPAHLYDQAAEAILGFRYSMLESGSDRWRPVDGESPGHRGGCRGSGRAAVPHAHLQQ